MQITCLLENTSPDPRLTPRHGLCLYIETREARLVFDLGPDRTVLKNAAALGVDLSQTDLGIISHGHCDHGGGIPAFQEVNPTATIHMTQAARGNYYATMLKLISKPIGLDWEAIDENGCRFFTQDTMLSPQLQLFTHFNQNGFIPLGNASLYKIDETGAKVRDDFIHETALLVTQGTNTVLVTGCSHSGIGNMVSTVLERTGLDHIDHVIGGFHLYNPVLKKTESRTRLDQLLAELDPFDQTIFHTGHCTGPQAFTYLKKKMGQRLQPLNTGTCIAF